MAAFRRCAASSFNVLPGEQLTLLGPSGCGKTTTLRAIAGLEQPTAGEIRIDGVTVYSAEQRINMRAEKRGLSMVFQSYAIWPHMTVSKTWPMDCAYAYRGSGDRGKVHHALDMVQMRSFASRRAAQLSGGQQQRVALARAFVFSPSVLLFRRAAIESRCQIARRYAHRTARASASPRHHLRLRDPRPGRSAGDVGSHRRDA